MQFSDSIKHTYSNNLFDIIRTLNSIESDTIACDFETASKWSDLEKTQIKDYLEQYPDEIDRDETRELRQYLESSGLSHPSLTYVTHLSVAWSPTEAFVAILDTEQKRHVVLRWLTTTAKKQVWHNYSFDGKLIMYHTGTLSKDYEDTEVLSKTLLNHTNPLEAKSGLKHLMGYKYGDWAVAKDHFNIDNMYNEDLIKYAAIDACATYALWEETNEFTGVRDISTSNPIDLLPLPEPRDTDYPDGWFYEHVAKHLISDTIRIMHNGLPINLDRVQELETKLDDILAEVQNTINNNKWIKEYQEYKFPHVATELASEIESKMRPPEFYLKEFKPDDMRYRSYFMKIFIQQNAEEFYDVITPIEEILPGTPKWTVRDVKPYVEQFPLLAQLVNKTIPIDHPVALEAMRRFAQDKSEIYNRSYRENIANISFTTVMKPFNPGSAPQKQDFFAWKGVEPIEFSKDTGEPSWGREVIEEVQQAEDDPDMLELYQAFIDFSFAAIVRNNFINAFYKFTVDGRLYGNYRLLGAKSGRYTSDKPNMLNAPSSRSIYSKPIKRCFTAPPGYIIYAIDYSALEDRVIASLTKDTNKCNVFLENLDGHCLNAYGYFKDRVAEHMGLSNDTTVDVKEFFRLVEEGHKELKGIRQEGKPATFGLSYGAYPPKVAKSLKIDLPLATEIFENYHFTLYPGITNYRENYVLTTAEQNRRIHLGMGFYIKTDNPGKAIRTLNNATCQFWSILTALAINKIHTLIDEQGLQDSIQTTSTIYDSIYFIVEKDAEILKWLNDNIVKIMSTDFIINQIVENEATGEIGPDWADLTQLPQNATVEKIQEMLDGI